MMFLALELEFTLEAWRFSFRESSRPKLKQLGNSITNNRGSQPYNVVILATVYHLK
jgi:hypothetical protein